MFHRRVWCFVGIGLFVLLGVQGCFVSPAVPCNRFDPGFDATQCTCVSDTDCQAGMRCAASRCTASGGSHEITSEALPPDAAPVERRLPPESPVVERGPETPADNPDETTQEPPPERRPACAEGSTSACYTGPPNTQGVGECNAGTRTCLGGQWSPCTKETRPTTETCDGKDNDCNGQIDNGGDDAEPLQRPCYGGPPGTEKNAPCKAGIQTCSNGAWGACKGESTPTKELCNKIDDDCNGKIDDAANGCECSPNGAQETCYSGAAGTAGKGPCKRGIRSCNNGKWGACTGQVVPKAELCNKIDDDCNGQIDDKVQRSCYSGPAGTDKNAPCKAGTETCSNGSWGACVGEVLPQVETCNGVDDDCNGQVDDGLTASADCVVSSAQGICAEGTQRCTNGALVCQPKYQATTERCNGVDDDCDGRTDELSTCVPTCLDVDIRFIDFGSLATGCTSATYTVEVTNQCSSSLPITSLRITPSGSDFALINPPPTSYTLPSGARIVLRVQYRPSQAGNASAAIRIVVGAQDYTEIRLVGEGIASSTTYQETFQVPAANKADVLFVVDNSCSMRQHQTDLVNAFPSYLTRANQYNADYQIGVITTDVADQGQLQGTTKIITPQTPNASSVFAQNAQVGISGSATERGLATAKMALSPQALAGQNKGFLRSSATLSLVFVSDEEDSSPGTAASYIQFFRSLKSQQNLLRASVLDDFGASDSRCNQPERCRYQDVMRAFGGIALRLNTASTTSIRSFLEQLADMTMGKQAYFSLKHKANPASIAVKVNGKTINQSSTNGWQYEANGNAVRFTGAAIPAAGSTVEISYRPGCP